MIFKLSQDVFKHSNEILLSLVYGEMEMYTYLSTSCMTQYAIKFTKNNAAQFRGAMGPPPNALPGDGGLSHAQWSINTVNGESR